MTSPPAERGLDVALLLARLWSERNRIAGSALAAALLAVALSFVLPKSYRAQAVILPPDESDLFSNLGLASRALSKFPQFGVLGDFFTPADIYKATLKSRTAPEWVTEQHGLQRVYRQKSREKTLKQLEKRTDVRLLPDGTISVAVEDRDPKRAAAMAASYVEALDRYNIEKRNTTARRTRMFLQRRMAETDSGLRVAEFRLRDYQQTHRAVAPTSMGSGDLQSAADVMARKLALEVRLGVLRGYLREDNEQIVQTRTELEQLNRSIAALPGLQSELVRLVRDYKVQEQLYLLLTAELEQARIREAQDTPTVSVLDPAVPPERASKPRRLVMTVAAFLFGLLGSAAWVLLRDRRSAAGP